MPTPAPHNASLDKASAIHAQIAAGIYQQGYSILPNSLPQPLLHQLHDQLRATAPEQFSTAGIGRERGHTLNGAIRKDQVCWITGSTDAGRAWLDWCAQLQTYLNRHLLLGLFSFESHFAHYPPGAFYKQHTDAFRGEANRALSLVLYLNPTWQPGDGGEMLLYPEGRDPIRVEPCFGTLATFLSEDFPHEVLPTRTDRYSIAGWFRVNTSTAQRIDPPT